MRLSQVRTDVDVERYKKFLLRDPELSSRLAVVRSAMSYPNDGVRHEEGRTLRMPTKAELLALYRGLIADGLEEEDPEAMLALRKIRTKSNSGVAVVSVLTKPFPCPGRCTYCPTDVSMPKSYLAKEPAAARALANSFDPYLQVTNRLHALKMNGHPIDKIELIVIGGTWSFYHPAYQEEFLIGCFRAANDYGTDRDRREDRSSDRLEELRALHEENEGALCRIIGLSIETRPDYITDYEVARLRALGVTKVEIGVQHVDDAILKLTQRDMPIARVKRATERLKNAGLKIVYHMMPNLPGSTPERDIAMFGELFSGEDFHPDMLKIYPCVVLDNSTLYETWKAGGYQPYTDPELFAIIREAKKFVPHYVRILRVYRDIPASYVKAGSTVSNLRQVMDADMAANGWKCKCIRCREIREGVVDPDAFTLIRREYRTETGREIFLSFEDPKERLVSFIRLRLPDDRKGVESIPELENAALVRELHTYGRHMKVGALGSQSQHVGFGRRLVQEAERIAREEGYGKIAIISGVGVRGYYRTLGYDLEGTYMVKRFKNSPA